MTLPTLGIDAYQLTTLLTHADEGRLEDEVTMSFFFRRMPKARRFVLFSGLRRIVEHAGQMAIDEGELDALESHSAIGPALAARPAVVEALRGLRGFKGSIDAMPEGSIVFAGPDSRTDGSTALRRRNRGLQSTRRSSSATPISSRETDQNPGSAFSTHE